MIVNGDPLLMTVSPIKNMIPSKQRTNGVSHGLAEVGYDIRIKQTVCFVPPLYHIGGEMVRGPRHSIFDPTENHPSFVPFLKGGNFCLASAMEEFTMPDDLVGIVHDKSTWARCGLSVFNTVIEPGWNGFLTLELVFHGNDQIIIPAGTGIAQVIFHQIMEPTEYQGSYQNQADEPVSSLIHKI